MALYLFADTKKLNNFGVMFFLCNFALNMVKCGRDALNALKREVMLIASSCD